ncbi:MAG: hypothetical protein AAFY88_08880 [Acidobacteriota bacterium]
MSGVKELRRLERKLPVRLSLEEQRLFGAELASKLAELGRVEDQLEEAKQRAKAEKAAIQKRVNHLQECINSGDEPREVVCREVEDLDERAIRVERLDTGEVVDERAMTIAELQRPMEFPAQAEGV